MTRPKVSLARREAPPLGDVLDFLRLLWAVDHAMHQTSERMRRTLGVTGPQRLVLRIVARFPGIPAGDLARLLHVHPSTLTGILARLERAGLLRRRVDARDRRRSLLMLTVQGRRFDVANAGTIEAAVARALNGMTPAQLEGARAALQALALALSLGAEGREATRTAARIREQRKA